MKDVLCVSVKLPTVKSRTPCVSVELPTVKSRTPMILQDPK